MANVDKTYSATIPDKPVANKASFNVLDLDKNEVFIVSLKQKPSVYKELRVLNFKILNIFYFPPDEEDLDLEEDPLPYLEEVLLYPEALDPAAERAGERLTLLFTVLLKLLLVLILREKLGFDFVAPDEYVPYLGDPELPP